MHEPVNSERTYSTVNVHGKEEEEQEEHGPDDRDDEDFASVDDDIGRRRVWCRLEPERLHYCEKRGS